MRYGLTEEIRTAAQVVVVLRNERHARGAVHADRERRPGQRDDHAGHPLRRDLRTGGRALRADHDRRPFGRLDARLQGDVLVAQLFPLGHLAKAAGGLRLPTLGRLGLGSILELEGVTPAAQPVLHGTLHGPGYAGDKGPTSVTKLPDGATSISAAGCPSPICSAVSG